MNRVDRQNRYRHFIRAMSACNNWSRSAIAVGVSRATVYNWQARSEEAAQADPPDTEHELFFEAVVGDGEPRFFSDHIRLGQLGLLLETEASILEEAAHGRNEVCRFRGATVWQRAPQFAGMSDEEAAGYGLMPSDLIMRDELGNPVPEMQHFNAGAEKQLAVLAAHYPELWGKRSSLEVTNNNNASGVLQIVDQRYQRPAQLEVLPDIVDVEVSEPTTPEPDPEDVAARRASQSEAVRSYEALLAMSPEQRASAAAARQAEVVENVAQATRARAGVAGLPGMSVSR
jgi:hypothetical protein